MRGTSHTLQPEQSHYMQAAALESLPRVENALRDAALAAKASDSDLEDGPAPWATSRALVRLAAYCQENRLRIRHELRGAAEAGWLMAQRSNASLADICAGATRQRFNLAVRPAAASNAACGRIGGLVLPCAQPPPPAPPPPVKRQKWKCLL